jgi:hypothetical protein
VIVLVLGVVMAVGMHVPCAVSMYVFVLVEDDFEVPAERVGDTAERFQAGDMIAAFQTRNHRASARTVRRARRCRLILDDARSSVDDVP